MRLTFTSGFTLLLGGGQKVSFAAGEQEVPDELVSHWYVQAHLSSEEQETSPPPGEPFPATDARAILIVEASSLGIQVDGRWGVDRIKAAIAAAKGTT